METRVEFPSARLIWLVYALLIVLIVGKRVYVAIAPKPVSMHHSGGHK
jgi:hypothetical protein